MDRDLQTILLRDNPWILDRERLGTWLRDRLPDPYLPRLAARTARRRWDGVGKAHLVIGPRQAGKSSAIWAHLAEVGEPALLIDCEQPFVQSWCRSAPLFLADLEKLLPQPTALFFEEVQHLDEAGLFLKGLVDRRFPRPLLVTGSSSYHLGARTRESLAGRATRTRLLPFSLAEVCGDLADRPELLRTRGVEERFARHLVVGGYPDVWLGQEPALLLADLVESVILRDASDLFRIGRPEAFRRLLRLAAGQVGSLINLAEWASVLGIDRNTVASYLEILESSHVTVALPPFAGGRRSELTRQPKIYFVDNGIRNRLLGDLGPFSECSDRGPVLESWVFTELWKGLPWDATLHFWRSSSKAEVDFVVVRGEDIVAVEVKAASLGRPTLPRAAHSFLDAYQPRRMLVVHTGPPHETRIGDSDVRWIAPWDLLEAVGEVFAPSQSSP